MNSYLEKLKAYVETHPIQFDDDCDFQRWTACIGTILNATT